MVSSTRLRPMWPGFDNRTRHHMWVKFVVNTRPLCREVFLLVLRFSSFYNSNLISVESVLQLVHCASVHLNKVIFVIDQYKIIIYDRKTAAAYQIHEDLHAPYSKYM